VCILILFSAMFALECEVRVAEILSEMLQDKVIITGKSRHIFCYQVANLMYLDLFASFIILISKKSYS
jgi:hypothetical protein